MELVGYPHQIFGLEARTIAAGLVSGGKPASL
ncbi:hypothetical protein ACVWXF_002012 [Thermostichus sp. MS-CIW-40]